MPAPIIAIPAYYLAAGRVSGWKVGGYGLPDAYVDAIARAGGQPVLVVSTHADQSERFDAVLLAGGGDLDPASYGADPHPSVDPADVYRDRLELALVGSAVKDGIPTLAICRGMQVLNVALSGTLHQHLPDLGALDHGRDGDADHPVTVSPGSHLAGVTGGSIARCVSHHHQGVDRLGHGLTPVGWSDDGLVEAVESEDGERVGVQWHPERSAAGDPVQQSLFDALVDRAHARRDSQRTQ
ncbi:MAG: gamma-glutamyl-gamma-aminobutyrate hydrolase family protein [Acidimicrobiales bacterium]